MEDQWIQKKLKIYSKPKLINREVDILTKTKATKDTTYSNSKAIEKLRDQLDHAIVLVIEWIKNSITWNGETKHSQVNKNASALQQLSSVYKWINDEYLYETSITDQIDQISRHTKQTSNTILPVTASKLFSSRRVSQNARIKPNTTLEINFTK